MKGTVDTRLWFGEDMRVDQAIVGYVDSDHVGSIDTMKSLTGFVYTLHGTTIMVVKIEIRIVKS